MEQLGAVTHPWDETAFKGVDEGHNISVVYLVKAAEEEAKVEMDEQHSDY